MSREIKIGHMVSLKKSFERKIGEVFLFNGEKLQCKENNLCDGCYFKPFNCNAPAIAGECSRYLRSDKKSVIFVKWKGGMK